MSSSSCGTIQLQAQERCCDCSPQTSRADANVTVEQLQGSWSVTGEAVLRQGSSPLRIQTKGRFTITEEEGSSPKLSFRLPSCGGSLSGQLQKSASGSSSLRASPGDYWAASNSGSSKAARISSNSGYNQPIKKPAAGALQMPAQAP